MHQKETFIVEVELSKKQLTSLNALLGFTQKSTKPTTAVSTLIRAVEKNLLTLYNSEL